MKTKMARSLVVSLLIASLLIIGIAGCSGTDEGKLSVVTSTSMLQRMVERLGGDLVEVVNIIPPAQCPGHFDVGARDIMQLADADLFFMHGWQGEKFTEELIESAENEDLIQAVINVQGNWMTPPVQVEAADVIAGHLCEVDPDHCSTYEDAAATYNSAVEAKGEQVKARVAGAGLQNVQVMCADMQFGFVNWLGLDVIETYGRPESFTPQMLMDLVDAGREAGVALIIDNLQSGKDAGAALAEDLECERVILTNFPGGFEGTETWEDALDYNVDQILAAISA